MKNVIKTIPHGENGIREDSNDNKRAITELHVWLYAQVTRMLQEHTQNLHKMVQTNPLNSITVRQKLIVSQWQAPSLPVILGIESWEVSHRCRWMK